MEQTGLNMKFSFFYVVYLTKAKESSLSQRVKPTYNLIEFLNVLVENATHTSSLISLSFVRFKKPLYHLSTSNWVCRGKLMQD